MKKSYSKSKKNFLALLLSVLMVTSCASVFSACGNDAVDSSTSSSEETDTSTSVKDEGLIKNASFKTADFNKNSNGQRLNPIVKSVTGWSLTRDSIGGNSAHTSQSESGILDVSKDAWEDLTSYDKAKVEVSQAEAEKNWSTFSTREKLEYYKYWKKDKTSSEKSKIATELKNFYEKFNIDEEDIPLSTLQDKKNQPIANPGVSPTAKEGDTNILMIRNQNPAYSSTSKILGSAQKYTSSSTVTVPAGAAAKFSVWVKTAELQQYSESAGKAVSAVDKGAYIRISHSVGNTSLPDFEVKNINTETLNPNNENNGWMQYEFYLESAAYTSTTFTLVLGLGQGSQDNRVEEVNGYAFFDEIQCEIVALDDGFNADKTVNFESDENEKTVDAFANKDMNSFALDFHNEIGGTDLLASKLGTVDVQPTTSEYNGKDVTSIKGGANVLPVLGEGLDGAKDFKGVTTLDQIKATTDNAYLTSIYNQYLKSEKTTPWVTGDQDVFLLMSTNGVAYEAKDALTFGVDDFKNAAGEVKDYILISLYAKTSDMNGCAGGGITLTDNKTKNAFSSIDTSDIAPVEIGEDKDVYDGWQQYLFFVENDFEEKDQVSFTISFNFGVTDLSTATKENFYEGFAAFTNLEIYPMDEKEYDAATTGTYAKKVTVTGKDADEATGNNGFDSVSNLNKTDLEEGSAFANLQNYAGVYSNSYYVSQPTENMTKEDELINFNQYANAGLINKEYFLNGTEESGKGYYDSTATSGVSYYLTKAAKASNPAIDLTKAEAVWNEVVGNTVSQPLFIWNDPDMANAYGYLSDKGKGTTIAANSYAAVSVRVKAVNAKASIYLIDMDDDTYSSTLSIGSNLVYWYDEDGNICTGENLTTKAFLLQPNGLYKANPKWNGYEKLANKDGYYANLTAYEKDANGNLIVAEDGASHDYTKEDANGNVIAFYCKDNKYYADADKKVEVTNLLDVTKTNNDTDETHPLPYRYLANAEKQLMTTVENTDGWVTVTFYIHTGNKAKNYRLEVWSGVREGAVSKSTAENPSYVLFDTNNPGAAETNFTNLLEESKDLVSDSNKFESIFSYFDSNAFLRYDKGLDTEKVGNLYKDSYNPTTQTAGIAYLYLDEMATAKRQTYFVDYSYSEVEVAAKAETDNDTEDSSSADETAGDVTNPWLLAGSLLIAAVLLFAIASIIIRKVLKNRHKARPNHKK